MTKNLYNDVFKEYFFIVTHPPALILHCAINGSILLMKRGYAYTPD